MKKPKAVVRGKKKELTRVRVEKADSYVKPAKKPKLTSISSKKQKGDIFEGKRDDLEEGPDQFLEDEEEGWPREDQELRMHLGKKTADVYTPEGREELEEDEGEIEPWEEGFMEGAEGRGNLGDCAFCEKPLSDEKGLVIEKRIKGKLSRFCSEKCASAGRKIAESL